MSRYKPYFSSVLFTLLAVSALLLLAFFSRDVMEAARRGLSLCARVIVPSLLPFFAVSALISELGIPKYLGRALGPFMEKLFGVGGAGASALVMGLSGGYPLGAATVADMYRRGDITKDEAERLLAFCNNSGPAFILGAAGTGVFGSAAAGFLLYGAHITSAVLVGILMSGKADTRPVRGRAASFEVVSFPNAFAGAVKNSVMSTITICGFVVFFSVLVGILDALGIFSSAAGMVSAGLGLELHWVRSLLTGILELGSGIGSMSGLPATPFNLALAAFILGWGGLSVHCQALSVVSGTGIKCARHFAGRIMHGSISALLVFSAATLFF